MNASGHTWQPGWNTLQLPDGLPLHVFHLRGRQPGKNVLITAGVHGDEYEGVAAVSELAAQLHSQDVLGTILLVPIVNPAAHLAGTRTNPADGLNLARCFPGDEAGPPTQKLAAFLFTHLCEGIDYAIDLHSGGMEYLFIPLAGFYGRPDASNPSYNAARTFGLPHLWQLPHNGGVLSLELWKRGTVAIGNEYLGAGQLSGAGVHAYRDGIKQCLAHWGVLPCPEQHAQLLSQKLLTGDWQLATCEGLFRAGVELGAEMNEGDAVAVIVNERGALLQQLTAQTGGTVAAIRSKARIRTGDWAVLVAETTDA